MILTYKTSLYFTLLKDLATGMKVTPQNLEELNYDTISSWEEK